MNLQVILNSLPIGANSSFLIHQWFQSKTQSSPAPKVSELESILIYPSMSIKGDRSSKELNLSLLLIPKLKFGTDYVYSILPSIIGSSELDSLWLFLPKIKVWIDFIYSFISKREFWMEWIHHGSSFSSFSSFFLSSSNRSLGLGFASIDYKK